MVSTSIRRNLLASTIIAGALVTSIPAFAQTTPAAEGAAAPADSAGSSDTIVVTGSLIRNPNLVSVSPVQVISQEELQLRQTNVAEEVLRDLPGVVPNVGSQVNNGNGGASFVDLRGLGPNRNLVLLDGQRLVPADINGSVDLNNIPLALVERVDALTGGAASTYGADAISGVINFITRRDFAGIEATSSEQITERGDGNIFRTDLTMGANFDDGRGNAVLSIGYQEADPVLQGSRSFSAIARSATTGRPAGSGTSVPSLFDGQASQIDPTTGTLVPIYALYNFNPVNIFQTPFKRYNIFGSAHYDVTDKLSFYTRALFSKNQVTQILAPGGAFGEPITINYNNPYLPASAAAQFAAENGLTPAQFALARAATGPADPNYATFDTVVNRRTVELGGRVSVDTTQVFDYKLGFKYDLTSNLSLDVGGNYGESERAQQGSGNIRVSRLLQAALASSTTACDNPSDGGCVPINLFGAAGTLLGTSDPAGARTFINADTLVTQKATLAQAHALLTGDVGFSSPFADSPISFAVGGEYRKYTASQVSDNLSQTPGEISGSGGAAPNIDGSYDVYEAYGEVIAPLVSDKPFFHSLQVEGGVRYSHYTINAAGNPKYNTTTYKGGGSWEPVEGVKLRGNYQHAVRAPNIGELFSPISTGLTNLTTDPCATIDPANGARLYTLSPGLLAVCTAQGAGPKVGSIRPDPAGQVNATGGGNPNLKPEKSNSYTFGVVLQPRNFVPGLTLSADYYHINITGAVGTPSVDDAVAACFGTATAATGDAGLPAGAATNPACTTIRRDPNTGGLYGNPGIVFGLPLASTNLGVALTDGIDVSASYRRDVGFAVVNLSFTGNWTNRSKFQATPTSVNRECTGYYSVNCLSIQPEFQWNTRATFSFDDVDLSVLWRHIDSERFEPGAGTRFAAYTRIPTYNYFDLATRFALTQNVDLTLTVTNLFDKDPPQVGYNIGSTTYNSGNTYPSTYDPLGRRYAVSARFKF